MKKLFLDACFQRLVMESSGTLISYIGLNQTSSLKLLELDLSSVYKFFEPRWSFGVVMWEIATRGMTPYSDVSDDDIKKFLEDNKRLEKPQGCSDAL